jgi:hypothetical protein
MSRRNKLVNEMSHCLIQAGNFTKAVRKNRMEFFYASFNLNNIDAICGFNTLTCEIFSTVKAPLSLRTIRMRVGMILNS